MRNPLLRPETFGFYHEVERLQSGGSIRGGSLDNAIVLTETGMLNDTALRFSDEFVRHKTLDFWVILR